MKKSGFVLKLIASIAIMALGAIMFIVGISGGFNCYTYTTWHESYGGDDYTGIQNAVSDMSTNVELVGGVIEDIACGFFFTLAIPVIGVGLYVLGSAISDKAMLNLTAAPQAPAAPVPQAPAYHPPQAPAYQPPQAPASGRDHSAELAKYETLLARGIITQEEFEAKKRQILGM